MRDIIQKPKIYGTKSTGVKYPIKYPIAPTIYENI